MKKTFSILLALALCCALTACGGQNDGNDSGQASQPPVSSQPQQPTSSQSKPNPGASTDVSGPSGSDAETGNSVLVAYFSATGTTKGVAELLADVSGADLYEIVPEEPYTSADLNYNTDCRANDEQNDPNARPAISGSVENMEQYDTILLGYPIWWGVEPKIVDTFLESYDLSGKTIAPFCTSGGSGVSESVSSIRELLPDANCLDGQRFSGNASQDDAADWLARLGLAG